MVDRRDWQRGRRASPVAGQPVFVIARPDGRQVWVNFAFPDNGTGAGDRRREAARSPRRSSPARRCCTWSSRRAARKSGCPRATTIASSSTTPRRSRRVATLPARRPQRHLLHRARARGSGYDADARSFAAMPPGSLAYRLLNRFQRGFPLDRTALAGDRRRARRARRQSLERRASRGRRRRARPVGAVFRAATRVGCIDARRLSRCRRTRLDAVAAARVGASGGQPQLRARARAEPVVRRRRARRGRGSAGCSTRSSATARCRARSAAWSRSTTSTWGSRCRTSAAPAAAEPTPSASSHSTCATAACRPPSTTDSRWCRAPAADWRAAPA